MKIIKYSFIICINLLLAFCAGMALANEPKTIYEQYFVSKIGDAKIGYANESQIEKEDNDQKLIITNRYSQQEFKRFGFTVHMAQDIQYVEKEDGTPVSFSAKVDSIGENINVQGKIISPDKIELSSNVNGVKKTEEIPLTKHVLFPYAIDKLFANNPSDKIVYSTIDPTSGVKIITVTADKVAQESLIGDNLLGNYTKYKISMDLLPNIGNYEWHNVYGRVIKEKSTILNLVEVAVNRNAIAEKPGNFDILTHSLVSVDAKINNPQSVSQASYKIQTQNSNPQDIFISDDRQRIVQIKDNTVYIKSKSESPRYSKYKYPVNQKGFLEFLRSGPFITSDSESIQKQANSLVGQEKDAYKIVKTMEKWVSNAITQKDFSVNFANADKIMKTRQGDCTEHSILLASLLRAAGIPSKVVIGLIYTDVPEHSFGYHMWVKAYIGTWINLDPSFPSENFSPIHIAMYESALNNLTDRTDIALNLLKSFSNFKINVLGYTTFDNKILDLNIYDSSKHANADKINILDILKGSESPIKKLSVKNNDKSQIKKISLSTKDHSQIINTGVEKKTYDNYIREAYYNYSKPDIGQARKSFEQAMATISFDNDFSNVTMATKLASLGLFNLAGKNIAKVHDSNLWGLQLKTRINLYFPKTLPSSEQETIFALALSRLNYKNDPNGALVLLSKYKKNLSNSDYACLIQGKAYYALNNPLKAINSFNKAITLNPENLNYKFELSRAYSLNKEYSKAEKTLDYIAKKHIPDDEFNKMVNAEIYLVRSKSVASKEVKNLYMAKYFALKGEEGNAYSKILEPALKNVKDPKVWNTAAEIYISQNSLSYAKYCYNLALKYDKNNVTALIGMGNLELMNGNYKEALKNYQNAYKLSPESAEILVKIAECYRDLSQEEGAFDYNIKALKADPNYYEANYNLGVIYYDLGELDKASVRLRKAVSVSPMRPEAWIALSKIQMKKKNYFLAKTYLAPVNSIDPQNSHYYYYHGLINKNIDNLASAKSDFQKALEINPGYVEAKRELKNLN